MRDRFGVSEPTVERLFHAARDELGVKLAYHRTNQPYDGAGELSVEDWGVFNRAPARQFPEE